MTIQDANLEAAIRVALNQPGGPIEDTSLASITSLNASGLSVANLSGLEFCTSLQELLLSSNFISDISPLGSLTTLTTLDLFENQVSNLAPLSGLTNLTNLFLASNQISDVSPLAVLTGLQILRLSDNLLIDISPLDDLTELVALELVGNNITDITALAGLTKLANLSLQNNNIEDIAPLAGLGRLSLLLLTGNQLCSISRLLENPGIGVGDTIFVDDNPLANFTCSNIIPALVARGATVNTGSSCALGGGAPCPVVVTIPDPNLEAALLANLGLTVGPLFDTNLIAVVNLNASSSDIVDLTGLEYCVNLTELDLSFNQVANLAPIAKLKGIEVLDLSGNQVIEITQLEVLVNIEDLNLGSNDLTDIAPLTNLTSMLTLDLSGNRIFLIAALSGMSAIEELDISSNNVSDLGALGDKTDLLKLRAASNQIEVLTPLAGAVSLQELDLFGNQIEDITALTGLTNLSTLALGSNQISDIGPLNNLDTIGTLDLSNNYIVDLEPIENMSDLETLNLDGNLLVDLTPLSGVNSLDVLSLGDNRIRNLAPLAGLNSLRELSAPSNLILDLSPLANLPQLNVVVLDNNQICTFAPLAANPSLAGDTDVVSVAGNPLSSFACSLDAGSLAGRSVQVETGSACDSGGGDFCTGVVLYVSPGAAGNGTAENPFGTIQDALDAAGDLTLEGFTVTIFLAPGDYSEVLEIPDGVRVVGAGMGYTRILPTAALLGDDDDDDAVVVRGGDDAGIEDLSVALPAGAPSATLIEIDGVDFEVLRVEVDGASADESTGIRVKGEDSSESLLRDSILHDLETAIEIDDSGADFGFNEIQNISGAAAVRITGDAAPRLGDLLDLRRSGSNIFRAIDGQFILTDSPLELRALANYWDNRSSISAIRSSIAGRVNVALPLFTTDSKGILAGSLFATVLDDDTEEPISNAHVSLVPMAGNLPKSSTPGVYVAGILPAGRYTVRAQEAGYEDEVQMIDVFAGINQVTLRMGSEGGGSSFIHSGDANVNARIELTELLRVIQLYNSPLGFSCGGGEDGYQLGAGGGIGCAPHAADYEGVNPNWRISLSELLRVVQIYNVGAYFPCGNASEDGFCPGGK